MRNGLKISDLTDMNHFEERFVSLNESLNSQFGLSYDWCNELNQLRLLRDRILPFTCDTSFFINQHIRNGSKIIAEGANAALIDIDFGFSPYVTSSNTIAGGISTGLGVAPSLIGPAIGVAKAYTTHVGEGPLPSQMPADIEERVRRIGHEYGTTTGRPRRCGWIDIPVLRYSHMLNNYSSINLSKLDVLTGLQTLAIISEYRFAGETMPAGKYPSTEEELGRAELVVEYMDGWKQDISSCQYFKDLPINAQKYVRRIAQLTGVPIKCIGVGPAPNDMIYTEHCGV